MLNFTSQSCQLNDIISILIAKNQDFGQSQRISHSVYTSTYKMAILSTIKTKYDLCQITRFHYPFIYLGSQHVKIDSFNHIIT